MRAVVYDRTGDPDVLTLIDKPVRAPGTYTAPARAMADAVQDVSNAVLGGAIRVGQRAGLQLHHFRLEEAAAAHAAVEASTIGRVLIDVAD